MKKSAKRWRKWSCSYGEKRYEEAQNWIEKLSDLGFKAKIWSPLPQHRTSTHVHLSVLCTEDQLEELNDLLEDFPEEFFGISPPSRPKKPQISTFLA